MVRPDRTAAALVLTAAAAVLGAVGCWRRAPTMADGGVRLVYQIEMDAVDTSARQGLVGRTIAIARRRIDPERVLYVEIRPIGEDRFEVLMPTPPSAGDQDVAALASTVKRKLGRIGKLEFRLLADDATQRLYAESGRTPEGAMACPVALDARKKLDDRAEIVVQIDDGYDLSGAYLDRVGRGFDEQGRPAISFTFNDLGAKRFGRLTGRNIGKQLAIILDGQVQFAPVIRSRIDRRGIIEGGGDGFTEREVRDLIAVLNSGALDAPLTLIQEEIVPPEGRQ